MTHQDFPIIENPQDAFYVTRWAALVPLVLMLAR